jgi:hypothetical protein
MGYSQESLKRKKQILREALGGRSQSREIDEKTKREREAGQSLVFVFPKFLVESFYGDPATSTLSVRQPLLQSSRVFWRQFLYIIGCIFMYIFICFYTHSMLFLF